MAPIITKAGIPYTSYSGASGSELASPNSFLWTAGFPAVLSTMASHAASEGHKSVTLYVTDNAAALGGAKAMGEPAFKAAGVTLNIVPIPLGDRKRTRLNTRNYSTSATTLSRRYAVPHEAGNPFPPYSGASGPEMASPNSFLWTACFPAVLSTMASHAASEGHKSVTHYVTDNAAALGGAKAMGEPAFKAAGVKLNIGPIPLGTPDATPQVSAGLQDTPGAIGIVGDARSEEPKSEYQSQMRISYACFFLTTKNYHRLKATVKYNIHK